MTTQEQTPIEAPEIPQKRLDDPWLEQMSEDDSIARYGKFFVGRFCVCWSVAKRSFGSATQAHGQEYEVTRITHLEFVSVEEGVNKFKRIIMGRLWVSICHL